MDYMNLKQGDVIVIHWKNERIIAIFDKYMYGYNSIRICCDLHEYHREDGYLCTEAERLHSFEFGLDNITYRKASEGEKNRIYNAIGKNLLSMMKIGINIQDYLFDIFCIDVKEYDDDLIYPDFINEIHTYIWDQLCQAMGCSDNSENEQEMINKRKFTEKVLQWIKSHINDFKFKTISYADLWDQSDVELLITDFSTIDEMEDSFRKMMEEQKMEIKTNIKIVWIFWIL